MKTIPLTFNGYWTETAKDGIPSSSGIYCVYACTHSAASRTVHLRDLIYVGESANVRSRISDHERLADWKKQLYPGETLCYSFASIGSVDRVRAEAAVIFHHKPPCNTEYKYSFPFEATTISVSGEHAKLDSLFTVYRT